MKQLHTKPSPGFTLVEVMIVLAISGLLLLIAFAGQRQLRSQIRFDSAIKETIQQMEFTRNYALSHVNPSGQGNDLQSELAGVAFEIDEGHPDGKLTELEPIYTTYDAAGNIDDQYTDMPSGGDAACPNHSDGECYEIYFNTSVKLYVANAALGKAQAIYLAKPSGLQVCGWHGSSWQGYAWQCSSANPDFGSPIDFVLKDDEGHVATIRLDPDTGIAKRI